MQIITHDKKLRCRNNGVTKCSSGELPPQEHQPHDRRGDAGSRCSRRRTSPCLALVRTPTGGQPADGEEDQPHGVDGFLAVAVCAHMWGCATRAVYGPTGTLTKRSVPRIVVANIPAGSAGWAREHTMVMDLRKRRYRVSHQGIAGQQEAGKAG